MLLLDLGNSSIKAQCWQAGVLQSSCRIRIKACWRARFEHYLSMVESIDCYYAGVPGSEVGDHLQACLGQRFAEGHLHRLQSQARIGKVVSAYPNPQGIGVDRWLALLGAAKLSRSDAIIVDAGSAITVDLLIADGKHLGGAIMPGFQTSLARFKKILSMADFSHPDIAGIEKPGISTESCIHISHDLEDTGYLHKLIDRWFKYLDKDAVLILAGGDAHRISPHPEHNALLIPDLVFQGMQQQLEHRE